MLISVGLYFFVMCFFPHHGAANFRYTSPDPEINVWNIGWPIATMIWDYRNGLHFGPWAVIMFPLLMGYAALCFGVFKLRRRRFSLNQ